MCLNIHFTHGVKRESLKYMSSSLNRRSLYLGLKTCMVDLFYLSLSFPTKMQCCNIHFVCKWRPYAYDVTILQLPHSAEIWIHIHVRRFCQQSACSIYRKRVWLCPPIWRRRDVSECIVSYM